MLVDDRAVAAEVLVQGDAFIREPQQLGEPALTVLERLAADGRFASPRSGAGLFICKFRSILIERGWRGAKMPKIAISYRRSDSQDITGRVLTS